MLGTHVVALRLLQSICGNDDRICEHLPSNLSEELIIVPDKLS